MNKRTPIPLIPPWPTTLMALALLALTHGLLFWLPGRIFSPETNLVLFAVNLYVLYCGWLTGKEAEQSRVGLFAVGYVLLFVLLVILLDRESLFILMVIVYASVFRNAMLLGVFVAFVLGYVVFQPYAFETFSLLTLTYLAVYRVGRSGSSRFLALCLALGLLALSITLLPLLHLLLQDSPKTLEYVLSRADVQDALLMSLVSSGTATLLTALWGIPLAYALARAQFPGKGWIESLIDLPILVPQSVVGIALLVFLGPGSPIGQALERAGLSISGRFAGLVVAQIFVSCPFLIKTAQTAFEGVPRHLEDVSRTLGASPLRTFAWIALPLASRGILVGLILAWARAISEFGAIILFAPHPLTAPVLVHNEFVKLGVSESRPIAVLLLLLCLWIFALLQFGKSFLPGTFSNERAGRLT